MLRILVAGLQELAGRLAAHLPRATVRVVEPEEIAHALNLGSGRTLVLLGPALSADVLGRVLVALPGPGPNREHVIACVLEPDHPADRLVGLVRDLGVDRIFYRPVDPVEVLRYAADFLGVPPPPVPGDADNLAGRLAKRMGERGSSEGGQPVLKVLVVDDDPVIRDLAGSVLASLPAEVHGIGEPTGIWTALERVEPDFLVLDIEMPHLSGLEICRALRFSSRWADLPVLVLTGRRDPETIRRVFAAGADDYLAKPLDRRELLTRVLNRLDRRKNQADRVRHASEVDPTTNLPNRARMGSLISRGMARVAERGGSAALLVVGIDHFRMINESLGLRAGDTVLRAVADILLGLDLGADVVGRLGGDTFVILLPDADGRAAALVAARVLEAIRHAKIACGDRILALTASIGFALFPGNAVTADALLDAAAEALSDAKERGRNAFCGTSPERLRQQRLLRALEWERKIREALDEDRFSLFAQPILHIASGAVSHYEVLIRMIGTDGKLVPPGDFLEVAEQFGLMNAIDRWVLERGVAALADLPAHVGLAVNISGLAFGDLDLFPWLAGTIDRFGVDASRLTLEITETAAVADLGDAMRFMAVLRELGCKFALDDFGVGFSSFEYLKRLPVDVLKIDGSFVRGLRDSETDRHLVHAMVEVARGLGKEVVAEFVEDEETVGILAEMGVDYAQGFHIGRPAPLSELLGKVPARPISH